MPSKSDEIRKLLNEGRSRSEVARIVGCSYQQVFQVDKKRHGGPPQHGGSRSVSVGHNLNAPGGYGNLKGPQLRFSAGQLREKPGEGRVVKIRTGPTQTRVAVQDGHEVRLQEDLGGTVCFNCKAPIQFSIRDLAYVHTHSGAPVTRLINMQAGPGLFE